jgi:hypothetical protein
MLGFLKREGIAFNEADQKFMARLERMPVMGFLSSQDEARVRSIYRVKTEIKTNAV